MTETVWTGDSFENFAYEGKERKKLLESRDGGRGRCPFSLPPSFFPDERGVCVCVCVCVCVNHSVMADS